jgi:hypothetical protein
MGAVRGPWGRVFAAFLFGLGAGGCGVLGGLTGPDGLSIQKFAASPDQVESGSTVALTWEVQGADSVQIDHGVGTVQPKGTTAIHPTQTTDYQLTARAGTSSATATVRVQVTGSSFPSPSPDPSPTPQASPSPSPSPTPSPSPSPNPSPSSSPSPSPSPDASPSPSPSPSPVTCGPPATFNGSCKLTISRPDALSADECIELTDVQTSADCPVNFGFPLSLSFQVTASTVGPKNFVWRQVAVGNDVLTPSTGTIPGTGVTTVTLSDLVLSDVVSIEVVGQGKHYLVFTLRH